MGNIAEVKVVLDQMKTIVRAGKLNADLRLGAADIKNMQDVAVEINMALYGVPRLKFQKKENAEFAVENSASFMQEMEELTVLWEGSVKRREEKRIDGGFWEIYECFKYADIDTICNAVVNRFLSLPEAQRIDYLALPHRYSFLKNKLDYTENDFSLIIEYVEFMANNVEEYRWLYEHLADYRSKAVLNGIVHYWFYFDVRALSALCETVFEDYYDPDIVRCGKEDVIADLGAYTGDSVLAYLRAYGRDSYKRIYAYELTPETFETMKGNLAGLPEIVLKQKGVGGESGVAYVNNEKDAGNKILKEGETQVEIVTLDEDITEPLTVIKMDIEGAECDALFGAAGHIQADKPKLLISAYHKPEDIFKIPRIISDMRNDYSFYIRFNGRDCLWPCDYVLIAI